MEEIIPVSGNGLYVVSYSTLVCYEMRGEKSHTCDISPSDQDKNLWIFL
jgi:hypothetical protein